MSQVHFFLVHGFLGGPDTFGRWRELIATDQSLRSFEPEVHIFEYFTSATRSLKILQFVGSKKKVPAIHTIAQRLAGDIDAVRKRDANSRVVVIGHSMGGLIARWAILENARLGKPGPVDLLLTLATPHDGGHLARFAEHTPFVSEQAKELDADGVVIKALEDEWSERYQLDRHQPMYAFVADQDGVICPPNSTTDYNTRVCPREFWDTLGADHQTIAKPDGLKDPRYCRPRDSMVEWLSSNQKLNDETPRKTTGDAPEKSSGSVTKDQNHSDRPIDHHIWDAAVNSCMHSEVVVPCLMNLQGWCKALSVINLLKNSEWQRQTFVPEFRAIARNASEMQLVALRVLASALIHLLFESRGVADIERGKVLAYKDDAQSGWCAYYLIGSQIEGFRSPMNPLPGQYTLDAPYAIEYPESPNLQDNEASLIALLDSIESKLGVKPSEKVNLQSRLGQANAHISYSNHHDGYVLLYGYECQLEDMSRVKSEHLPDLRMVELASADQNTNFELQVIALCRQTLGMLEELRPDNPEVYESRINPRSADTMVSNKQDNTGDVTITGDNNNVVINKVENAVYTDVIEVLEEIRQELRRLDNDESDELASEAKHLIARPASLNERAGDFLNRVSNRASEGSKLFDLVSKAHKAFELISGGAS